MELNDVLSFDEAIEIMDEPEYLELAPGEYDFTVRDVAFSTYEGSSKIPSCPMVEARLSVVTDEGETEIIDRFYYCRKMRYKLSSFARTLGLARVGDKITIEWKKLITNQGRARISLREYNGKKYNQIDRYIVPTDEPAPF